MVIDYTYPGHAISAQKVLASVGVRVVYIPYLLVAQRDDPAVTQLIVHRVEFGEADTERACRLLLDYGLLTSTTN